MKNEIRQIAIKINTLKDLDLFENSRKRDVVESRAGFTKNFKSFYFHLWFSFKTFFFFESFFYNIFLNFVDFMT